MGVTLGQDIIRVLGPLVPMEPEVHAGHQPSPSWSSATLKPAPWVSQLSQLDGTVSPVPMGPALNEDISSVSQGQDAPLRRGRTYPGCFTESPVLPSVGCDSSHKDPGNA